MIYLIGSLRNPKVPEIAKRLRQEGIEVFAEWFAAGPEADDYWKAYEQSQGYSYIEALSRPAAKNVFAFDRTNLDRSSTVVLVLPAGRSGHLELGYGIGSGKPGYILLDDPDRWDVMYQFASGIYTDIDALIKQLTKKKQVHFLRHGRGCSCEPCKKNPYIDVETERKELRESSANQLPKIGPPNSRLCGNEPSTGENIQSNLVRFLSFLGNDIISGKRSSGNLRGNRPLDWSTQQILKALRSK